MGTGQMVQVEVVPGGLPQGAENRLWHRSASAEDGRSPVESLGHLDPMAMRLLWLRQTAQQAPDTPATEVVSPEVIYVVTRLDNRPGATLTANDLWRTIARFGGYFNRKR